MLLISATIKKKNEIYNRNFENVFNVLLFMLSEETAVPTSIGQINITLRWSAMSKSDDNKTNKITRPSHGSQIIIGKVIFLIFANIIIIDIYNGIAHAKPLREYPPMEIVLNAYDNKTKIRTSQTRNGNLFSFI